MNLITIKEGNLVLKGFTKSMTAYPREIPPPKKKKKVHVLPLCLQSIEIILKCVRLLNVLRAAGLYTEYYSMYHL